MDKINVNDLKLFSVIGFNDWERNHAQLLIINLTVYTDLSIAGKSDQLEDTIDYSKLAARVKHKAENNQRLSLESLASDLADICLEDVRVVSVMVRLEKPEAIPDARSAEVEILRSKAGD